MGKKWSAFVCLLFFTTMVVGISLMSSSVVSQKYQIKRFQIIQKMMLIKTLEAVEDSTPENIERDICHHILGTGSLDIVIVPSGFDGNNENDVNHFELLSFMIANKFGSVEPFKSNKDRFSIYWLNDYRGKDLSTDEADVWYNPDLINAASLCNYDQIIVVSNNGVINGGNLGYYSAVFSGTPTGCNRTTCTGTGCPYWSPTCSNDYGTPSTALHEAGHTFVDLPHIESKLICEDWDRTDTIMCPVLQVEQQQTFSIEEQQALLDFLLKY